MCLGEGPSSQRHPVCTCWDLSLPLSSLPSAVLIHVAGPDLHRHHHPPTSFESEKTSYTRIPWEVVLFLISPTLQLFRHYDSLMTFVSDACYIYSPSVRQFISLPLSAQGVWLSPSACSVSQRMETGLLLLPTSCLEVTSCFLHPTSFSFSVTSVNSLIPWGSVSSLRLGSPSAPRGTPTKLKRKPCHPASSLSAFHHLPAQLLIIPFPL